MSGEAPFFSITDTLPAAIADVWDIIADFGGLKRWSAAIESCIGEGQGVGALRRVQVGGGEILERLEEFDPPAHYLKYRPISGSVMPIDDLVVSMKLTALEPEQTRLDWAVYGTPTIDPGKAKGSLQRRYAFRIGELKECLAGTLPAS